MKYCFSLLLLAVVTAAVSVDGFAQTKVDWPHIREFDKKFSFESRDEMFLRFPVLALNGRTAYIVECASPFANDSRIKNFNWSGDFECRVAEPDAQLLPGIQLLAESNHITKEWQGRGRFWWNELTQGCIGFPDWGGMRVYSFRKMRITVRITNPKLATVSLDSHQQYSEILRGFNIEISGQYDGTAYRPVAGLAKTAEPLAAGPNDKNGLLRCEITQK